jgi:hypothetical protein
MGETPKQRLTDLIKSKIAHRNQLQKGDFLLVTNDTPKHIAIRVFSWGKSSHAILYIGGGMVIEAVCPRIKTNTLEDSVEEFPYVRAYTKDGLTGKQRDLICDKAKLMVGSDYDKVGAICCAYELSVTDGPKAFCSGVVVSAYDMAGVPFSPRPLSPGGIQKYGPEAGVRWLGWLKNPMFDNYCEMH